jgi:hypothetical protein
MAIEKKDIIEKILSQIPYKPLNKLQYEKYIYTLSKYREILNIVIDKYKSNPLIASLNEKDIDNYLLEKINLDYHPLIVSNTAKIAEIPLVEQKSPEWYKLREGMISASDAGYFLKKCGAGRAMDTLRIKLGLKTYPNSTAPPLVHGNTYEDVSRAIYESRNKVVVAEYGIISSIKPFIGASPDGIVVECLGDDWECKSRLGRLLEIKNPYSREIDETIKPEYMVQILQQQYTTNIPVCDFVETTIVDKYCRTNNTTYKPYENIEDMLMDKLDTQKNGWQTRIKNPNIPSANLTKFGYEKGLIIWYQKIITDTDTRNKYILYPLTHPYNKDNINTWIDTQQIEMTKEKYIFKEIKYWRLEVYSEKTVIYNQLLYEGEYIPILKNVWDIITEARKIISGNNTNENNDIEKYLEQLENDIHGPFYNENKNKKKIKQNNNPPSNNNTELDYEIDM